MNTELNIIDKNAWENDLVSPFGKNPEDRSLSEHINLGFINLDKPAGPTSHEVVSIVKTILNIPKAGHSGTLDPQVTGVLPVGLLTSTKVLSILLLSEKQYICNMYCEDDNRDKILKIMEELKGSIYQVPPLKSNVVKKLRVRKIYDLICIEQNPHHTLFLVKSEAGTYIRTLCTDIGRATGFNCYMKELRRIRTGPFTESTAITLHELFDAWEEYNESKKEEKIRMIIRPIEEAIVHLPKVIIKDSFVNSVCHGLKISQKYLTAHNDFNANQQLALMTSKNELIGIGISMVNSSNLMEFPEKLLISPKKIVMTRDLYPRYV